MPITEGEEFSFMDYHTAWCGLCGEMSSGLLHLCGNSPPPEEPVCINVCTDCLGAIIASSPEGWLKGEGVQ